MSDDAQLDAVLNRWMYDHQAFMSTLTGESSRRMFSASRDDPLITILGASSLATGVRFDMDSPPEERTTMHHVTGAYLLLAAALELFGYYGVSPGEATQAAREALAEFDAQEQA